MLELVRAQHLVGPLPAEDLEHGDVEQRAGSQPLQRGDDRVINTRAPALCILFLLTPLKI